MSTNSDPSVLADARNGLPAVTVGPYGGFSDPNQTPLPTKKGPSPMSLAVSNLSSTLPGAVAAFDAKGVLPFHVWASGSLQLERNKPTRPTATTFQPLA